jgi:hypothetical protein
MVLEKEKDGNGNGITMKTVNENIDGRFARLEKRMDEIEIKDAGQNRTILRVTFYLSGQPEEVKLVNGLRCFESPFMSVIEEGVEGGPA